MDRRLRGIGRRRRPPVEKKVSVSFRVRVVRASGRGEAVWACERGVFGNAGPQNGEMSSGRGLCPPAFLMLCSWVLRFFGTDCCYSHGLFDLFSFLMVCSWVF